MKKILTILTLLFSVLSFCAPTTWNGFGWSNGVPTSNDEATITGNYTVNSLTGILDCKSLIVRSNAVFTVETGYYVNIWAQDLEVIENGKVFIKSGADILIRNGGGQIKNTIPANFVIENGGAIIQLLGNASNVGSITFKRNTKPVKLNDYTYWSSPVSGQLYNQLPPFTTGMRIFTYSNSTANYGWGNNLVSTNGIMAIGKGYISHKGVVNDPNPQQVYNMDFVGVPNNGDISVNLTSFIGNRPNVGYMDGSTYLTGNPYPSSLDMVNFLTTNNSSAIYLWTHNTVISSSIAGSEIYNYTADDYATFNLTGASLGASSPIVDGNNNNLSIPSRYIGSGQAFFVKAPILGAKTFTFDNSMRGYLTAADNTQFYKQNQKDEQNRIWLVLTNNFNITRHSMVGYVSGASDNLDHQYDADIADGRVAAIYSVIDDKDLAIQGRGLPFNPNDKIVLGYKLPIGGNYQIGLNAVDGLFENNSRPIYLEDKLLGITHNLRNGNYSFNVVEGGIVEDRFILKFTKSNSNNKKFNLDSDTDTLLFIENDNITIGNNYTKISQYVVYDMLGREVISKNSVNSNQTTFTLDSNGVYVVKVSLSDGTLFSKKISK